MIGLVRLARCSGESAKRVAKTGHQPGAEALEVRSLELAAARRLGQVELQRLEAGTTLDDLRHERHR